MADSNESKPARPRATIPAMPDDLLIGLVIAIPSMIAWRHFRALVDSFVVDMEQQAVKLVEVVHGDRS